MFKENVAKSVEVKFLLRRVQEYRSEFDAGDVRALVGQQGSEITAPSPYFEHAVIGRAYGTQGLAFDVRLAYHGIDKNDNEFIIGLVGKDLHPLSHVVQTMRKTRQTAEYIANMGPFFIGRAAWRSGGS